MKCPYCKESETKVIDTRAMPVDGLIRRRRLCPRCTMRFTTREMVDVHYPRVVKKSGCRSQFNEDKIRRGLARALEKRDIDAGQIESMVQEVKDCVVAMAQSDEIESAVIGALVLDVLRKVDEVAYIRFASVYKSFADIESFQKLINDLKQQQEQVMKEEV